MGSRAFHVKKKSHVVHLFSPILPHSPVLKMSDALFSYGTLQLPEVMQALIGHALLSVEGKAFGYARFCFSNRIYPGMVACAGALTAGRVYTGITARIWTILDQFEDPVYERELIEICRSDGTKMRAQAYILTFDQRHLLSSELWEVETFVETHLEGYVSRCRIFGEALSSGLAGDSQERNL
jgi:gamma-glutamylcyclotransferase (GGCT)/AIG2-like uncharacterized protein YtfP